MKRRNAVILLIILALILSVVFFIVYRNNLNNNNNQQSHQVENISGVDNDDNAVETNENYAAPENNSNDNSDEHIESTDVNTYENTVIPEDNTETTYDGSAFTRIVENIDKKIIEISPSHKPENSEALAGSFWDEPLVQSVYSRFSASEIALAAEAMSGGLSGSEKKAVKDMIYGRVSASEIAELQRLYQLHGGK